MDKLVSFDDNGFALSSGRATFYAYDQDGVYTQTLTDYPISQGKGKPAGSSHTAPPEADVNHVAVINEDGETWSLQPTYYGKTAYDIHTGQPVIIQQRVGLPDSLIFIVPPNTYSTWDRANTKWVTDPDLKKTYLADKASHYKEMITRVAQQKGWILGIPPMPENVKTYLSTLTDIQNGQIDGVDDVPDPPSDVLKSS